MPYLAKIPPFQVFLNTALRIRKDRSMLSFLFLIHRKPVSGIFPRAWFSHLSSFLSVDSLIHNDQSNRHMKGSIYVTIDI